MVSKDGKDLLLSMAWTTILIANRIQCNISLKCSSIVGVVALFIMCKCVYMSNQKHQQELSQLQDLLRERNKENRRLKSSFDTIKELNDNMKKQVKSVHTQIMTLCLHFV